ncbi:MULTISPECIES: helix-turn-helix domain-containing protein [Lysinibacillus]|uniref:Transcriptional regulator, XRE family with cupin sensor n=1 Tax=Lysinibacillus fusiformis TaxID=28031 RepID=A0A1H9MHB9_9BACI|nr:MULTISPECIES: XRE family transcriptional regulator [Lysinibacillus]EAZ85445.1 transcriptional regulator [Bacillus sp. B14905]MCG7435065.1 XRE family transcriptional regulator [Lysinibacillus fusiformis]MED4669434.1 XRE family transcriptional regulator [Lysinibacillus fusiformis]PCD84966.1 XRE family transcriptional regulator [Lysinibacillus fusiformis]QAS56055.1 XRE family transcriptional regulator [Lysinibacillus sphaericus]
MEFGKQVNFIRKKRGMSLQELSALSKVSTSMLSQIERGGKNPTITVACQIAEALNTTLSALLDSQETREIVVIRKEKRPVYFDESSGFQRHLLSPSFPSRGIEFVKNVIPPLSESGIFPAHKSGVKEYIYVEKGSLNVELSKGAYKEQLNEGDSFFFEANTEHRFINETDHECIYFLVIDSTQSKNGS